MRIEETWSYDADAHRVYAMTIDPRFQESKCRHAAAVSYSAGVTHKDGHDLVLIRRSMSTEGFPPQLRSMIGNTINIEERQLWPTEADADGRREAEVTVAIMGAPVMFTGRLQMTPQGESTSMRASGDLRARVPLFGGKIEEAAVPAITGAIEIERSTGRSYLEQ
ncbi:DUF2505 domain-containing protein [Leekyejoonella antrihumi]|uniref:DUF2505 domain-containing protein n=1 Tax=Leekyejoonella antrihumi TaxID=1660198 RepID=A0A563DY10_9MICO|nr:DUF2505 domain-containing protein [Leekyejoonella antrihumi]TWP35117.1 DUF2505 domain-containing protein [Leekyejoonella antrihumi]